MIVSCETFQPRTGADSFGEREMAGQEDVDRYLREVIAEAEALRIPLGSIKPEVRINSRAKKKIRLLQDGENVCRSTVRNRAFAEGACL